jgi:gluconate 2-dehydrogenase gamma chain
MSKRNERAREYRGERLHALTARQARLIDAIAARIFPATDPSTQAPALAGGSCSGFRPQGVLEGATGLPVGLHTPGAVEAGAVFYVDRALADAYPDLLPFYARGLRALDKHAKKQFDGSFLKLSEDQQDAVLRDFEAGRVDDFAKAGEFFETARNHILEGVFGEPKYGGNRDMIGWRLVGFPGQQFGYPDPYINKVVDMEPVACDGPPKKLSES